jgi:S1-C subfamily serine protease
LQSFAPALGMSVSTGEEGLVVTKSPFFLDDSNKTVVGCRSDEGGSSAAAGILSSLRPLLLDLCSSWLWLCNVARRPKDIITAINDVATSTKDALIEVTAKAAKIKKHAKEHVV